MMQTQRNWVLYIVATLGALALLGLGLCGCATAYDNAMLTRGAMSKALGESATAWLEYDRKQQMQIVKLDVPLDVRIGKLEQWRAHVQAPVVEAFHAAEEGIRALDGALKEWKAGHPDAFTAALAVARRSIVALAESLKAHGIAIPLPDGAL